MVFAVITIVPKPLDQVGHKPFLVLQGGDEPAKRTIVTRHPISVIANRPIRERFKALYFDLRIKDLEEYYSKTRPKGAFEALTN